MIDLHSHILYGLDDGAESLEQSIAMVTMAAEHGTTDIVASPHANHEYRFFPDLIEARIAEVRAAVGDRIRIHPACDFHMSWDNIQDAFDHPAKYTINHRNYLLVEFSDLLIPKTVDDVLYRMLSAGIVPVITHPERNPLLQKRIEKLGTWVAQGCLLQVTAASLLGRFGKRARAVARELMARNLVQVVSSDGHNAKRRPPVLDEAYAWVEKEYGRPRARALFVDIPRAAIEGKLIEWPPEFTREETPRATKKWYRFW